MNLPLVSCLCVTDHSVAQLRRAVSYFFGQTYPEKELVVLHTDDRKDLASYIGSLSDKRIVHVEVPALTFTLGVKRNLAIDNCNGEYFCIWDDDDWMHAERIQRQMDQLQASGSKANVLSNVLIYDSDRQVYLSARRPWEATLLCDRSVIDDDVRYADLPEGEDSPLVAELLNQCILSFQEHPYLYIYCYHGTNTSSRRHWNDSIIRYAMTAPASMAAIIQDIIANKYSYAEASVMLDQLFEEQNRS